MLKYGLGHWEFVKGHKEENETDKKTIFRELEEETGIKDAVFIEGFSENYEYFFKFKGKTIHKRVTCYLINSNTKKVKLSYEHDDFRWLTLPKALKRVTYANARKLLVKADEFRKSPLAPLL